LSRPSQAVTVNSGSGPVLHVPLSLAGAHETVTVSGAPEEVAPTDSVTPTTLVDRLDIERTPGADRSNLAMITEHVPGAHFTHNQQLGTRTV